MGNISSIHFKKSIYIQTKHNDRTLPPSYLIGGEVEVNRNHQEADILKKEIIDKAMRKYTERTKQKFQGKSFEWSAVVNLKEDSTMQDLERLALHFQENYGLQCYQIAIHRDEGHIDENGEKKLNHHAHLEFITLDKNTGVNRFREIKLPTLRKIQSEVAQILGMERGVDNRISKTKRIEPRVYASLKEKEKKAKLNRKALIKEYTEQMKGKGYKQTDFQAMRGIANDEELESEEKIREQIKKFLEERAKEIEELNKEPEVITITKEKEVIKEVEKEVVVMPSFEEIKNSLNYEQKTEIAEPFVEGWKKMKQEAEKQKDEFYKENLELRMENKALYEARGYRDVDLIKKIANLEEKLEEAKKTPQNQNTAPQIVQKITEEQKQEIIAPYKEKIDFLEKVIQSFHNLLVKLKIKPSNSNIYEVPQLQQPKQERMCPQRRAELEKKAKSQEKGGMSL